MTGAQVSTGSNAIAAGYYDSFTGQTGTVHQSQVVAGYYGSVGGQSASTGTNTIAAGYYDSLTGQSGTGAQQAIAPGYYDSLTGQSGTANALPIAAGYYGSVVGQTASTGTNAIAAGYYDSLTGQSGSAGAQAFQPGYYGSAAGLSASSQGTAASPGYYVSGTGATSQTAAPVGYYVAGTGATAPTEAQAGYYVSSTGATSETKDDVGFYSYAGDDGEQRCPPGDTCTNGILVPATPPSTIDLSTNGSSNATTTITQNTFAPVAVPLVVNPTDGSVQIDGWSFSGGYGPDFTVSGIYVGEVVANGTPLTFTLTYVGSEPGPFSTTFTIDYGTPDPQSSETINVDPIPEPASGALVVSAMAGLAWLRRKFRGKKTSQQG